MLDTSLMMPLRTSEETNHSCKAIENANSPINSLPSCGSLEDSYSEDEKHFGETIQNSSSSLPVYVDVASCHRLSRVGKSHSFQTKKNSTPSRPLPEKITANRAVLVTLSSMVTFIIPFSAKREIPAIRRREK